MSAADYSKRQLKTVWSPLESTDLNLVEVTTLTCCNIQVKQQT